MPAEETVVLYGAKDNKDTWTHEPAGGFAWERTKRVGLLEPEVPTASPNIFCTGERLETIQVEAFTIPPGKEVVSAALHVYLLQENTASEGLMSFNGGFAKPLAEYSWKGILTGWVSLLWNSTLAQAEVTAMTMSVKTGAAATGKQRIRALYFVLKLREKEEPPPSTEVKGSVPRGKTGTPRYRGNVHSEFDPIDVVEEERHYRRTLARLLFGVALIVLLLIAAWGLFNSWGDAAVVKAAETVANRVAN